MRENVELSIQERLKKLHVERNLTLEQIAEKTHLSHSALGSYEGDNFKDISHYALIKQATSRWMWKNTMILAIDFVRSFGIKGL